MKGLLESLKGMINSEDPTRDLKLAAFGTVVAASIFWLTREQHTKGITDQWVNAFYGLCALVGLGGTAWAAVDKWRKGGPGAPSNPPEQGAKNEGGGGEA